MGVLVGTAVGVTVGIAVGVLVGVLVGTAVGKRVGRRVGAGVYQVTFLILLPSHSVMNTLSLLSMATFRGAFRPAAVA